MLKRMLVALFGLGLMCKPMLITLPPYMSVGFPTMPHLPGALASSVKGTGLGGRISKKDIQSHLAQPSAATHPEASPSGAAPTSAGAFGRRPSPTTTTSSSD